jgi:hypothetical protein
MFFAITAAKPSCVTITLRKIHLLKLFVQNRGGFKK